MSSKKVAEQPTTKLAERLTAHLTGHLTGRTGAQLPQELVTAKGEIEPDASTGNDSFGSFREGNEQRESSPRSGENSEHVQRIEALERLRRRTQSEHRGLILILSLIAFVAMIGGVSGFFLGALWITPMLWFFVFVFDEFRRRTVLANSVFFDEFRDQIVRPWFKERWPGSFMVRAQGSADEIALASRQPRFSGLPLRSSRRVKERLLLDRDPHRTTIYFLESESGPWWQGLCVPSSFLAWRQSKSSPDGPELILADRDWQKNRTLNAVILFCLLNVLSAATALFFDHFFSFKIPTGSGHVFLFIQVAGGLALGAAFIAVLNFIEVRRARSLGILDVKSILSPEDLKLLSRLDLWTLGARQAADSSRRGGPERGSALGTEAETLVKAIRVYSFVKQMVPERRVAVSALPNGLGVTVELKGGLFQPPLSTSFLDGASYPDWVADARLIDSSDLRRLIADLEG